MCHICYSSIEITASTSIDTQAGEALLETLGVKGLVLYGTPTDKQIKFLYNSIDLPKLEAKLGAPTLNKSERTYAYKKLGTIVVNTVHRTVAIVNSAPQHPKVTGDEPAVSSLPLDIVAAFDDAVAHKSSTKCKQTMLKAWRHFNKDLFHNKLTRPVFGIIPPSEGAVSFGVRGWWKSRTQQLELSPRVFNAGIQVFVEVLLHEMCISGDALIPTDVGLVRMDRIKASKASRVLTKSGTAKILKFWCSGVKQTKEIVTEYGNSLRLTDNHPVLTLNTNCKFVWKRVDELLIGDFVVGRLGTVKDADDTDLNYALKSQLGIGYIQKHTPKLPTHMTDALARLLGYLAAEGSFLSKHNPNTIEFSNKDKSILNDYKKCWVECFGFAPSVRKYKDTECYSLYATRKDLAAWFEAVGFKRGTAPTKSVPKCILRSSVAHQIQFLKAFVEGDGHVNKDGKLDITSASKTMLHQIKLMFAQAGLVSKLESKSAKGSFNESGEFFRLRVFDGLTVIKTLGAVSNKRKEIMQSALLYHKIKTQSQLGKHWKISYACSWMLKAQPSISKHLRKSLNGDLYPKSVKACLAHLSERNAVKSKKLLGNFIFERIVSIKLGKVEKVYDMETDKGQFVANGIVVHNCHQAVTQIDKPERQEENAGHGPLWIAWMRRIGQTPSQYDMRDNDAYMDTSERKEYEDKKALGLRHLTKLVLPMAATTVIEGEQVHGVIVGPVTQSQKRWDFIPDPPALDSSGKLKGWKSLALDDLYEYRGSKPEEQYLQKWDSLIRQIHRLRHDQKIGASVLIINEGSEMNNSQQMQSLKTLITSFLVLNPSPKDEQVHALAAALGCSHEALEEVMYKMLSSSSASTVTADSHEVLEGLVDPDMTNLTDLASNDGDNSTDDLGYQDLAHDDGAEVKDEGLGLSISSQNVLTDDGVLDLTGV